MSPAERRFWQLAQRRVAGLQSDVAQALLRAFAIIRDSLSEAELARLIENGSIDRVVREALDEDVLDRAFLEYRQKIRQTTEKSFKFTVSELPKAGKIDGVLSVAFDSLNPRVIDAVRSLESKAINTLKGEVKEVVRAYVENGLRDGRPPRAVARQLRSVIGLAPNQEAAVRNFEKMLRGGDSEALNRALRDKRFDGTLKRAFADGKTLTEKQIETMTGAYKRKFIAFNSNVNAKLTTLDAYRVGQRLSWEDAKAKGVIPDGFRLMKSWVHLDPQENPRPEHQRLHGETVPADQPYSTGQMSAGEGDYGCHCTDRYFIARA